jgi:O-antigen ligase
LIHTDILKERWVQALERGTTSGREKIYATAWGMVQDKPVVGWGPSALSELSNRMFSRSQDRATHNMALAILTFAGFAGFLPYLYGYVSVFLASWRARSGTENVLPLTIFGALFVTDMITGGLPGKMQWTFYSYILASGHLATLAAKARAAGGAMRPRPALTQGRRS